MSEERTCPVCRTTFTVKGPSSPKRACSPSCGARGRQRILGAPQRPSHPVYLEQLAREPRTVVAVADLVPIIEEGIERAGGKAIAFGAEMNRFGAYESPDNAAKRVRELRNGLVPLVNAETADVICLAAGQNISQLPIPVLPSSFQAAELMIYVSADLSDEELTADERQEQARRLLSVARGYVAGLSGSEDELIAERKRDRDEVAA